MTFTQLYNNRFTKKHCKSHTEPSRDSQIIFTVTCIPVEARRILSKDCKIRIEKNPRLAGSSGFDNRKWGSRCIWSKHQPQIDLANTTAPCWIIPCSRVIQRIHSAHSALAFNLRCERLSLCQLTHELLFGLCSTSAISWRFLEIQAERKKKKANQERKTC